MNLNQIDIDLFSAAQIITSEQRVSVDLLKEKLRISSTISKRILNQLSKINLIKKSDYFTEYTVLINESELMQHLIKLHEDYKIEIPLGGRFFTNIGTDLFVAAKIVTSLKQVSSSLLMRKLRTNHEVTFKIIQLLEKNKVIEKISPCHYRVLVEFTNLIPFVKNLNEPNMIIPLKERIFIE